MKQFFAKRAASGHGPAGWVLLVMLAVVPAACWSLAQIDLENDVAGWLPADDHAAGVFHWYCDHFSSDERMLVSWDGSSLDDPRVNRLAARLRGTPDDAGGLQGGLPHVSQVVAPGQIIEQMTKRGVSREQAIERLTGVLVGRGMLRVRLTDAGRRDRKRTIDRLRDRLQTELGIAADITQAFDSATPAKTTAPVDEETPSDANGVASAGPRLHDFQIGWETMQSRPREVDRVVRLAKSLRSPDLSVGETSTGGRPLVDECFFEPGAPVALLISLSDSADEELVLAAVRRDAAAVGIDADSLHMGGRPVAGSALDRAVKKVAWNANFPWYAIHKRSPLLTSGILAVLLAFVVLRSLRMATVVLIVTFYTTFLAVALVPVTGGSMNMVLVVMPTLLIVLTLSAAIHVANYWKHAAFRDLPTAVVEATRMARQPCTLASVTTAIGLVSLSTSPLRPVRDFGIYSALGCLLSLAMVLYVLPWLLQLWPAGRPARSDVNPAVWNRLGNFLSRHRIAVMSLSLLGMAAGAYGLTRFRTETKVIRYFPDEARIVGDYEFLEQNLAGIVPVEMIVRFDANERRRLNFLERLEIVRRIENRLREHAVISGTISLADFQPEYEPPPPGSSTPRRLLHAKQVREIEKRVKTESEAARSFLTLAADPGDRSERIDGRLNRSGDELWRITAQVSILSDLDDANLTRDLDAIADAQLAGHPGAGHVVTGMVPLFLRTQQAVLDSLIRSFSLAFLVIGVVMMILLRHPLAGLFTMLPNLLPVAIVFGLISWCGIAVDIGTMITASVALGIAVDGTLHLLSWFRAGIAGGMSRREAVSHALVHAGPAMWQTSVAVGMGLLMLAGTELLLVSRFGWLMAALIGTALLADLIFLPALLAGPLGALIAATVRREMSAKERASTIKPVPSLDGGLTTARLPIVSHANPGSAVQVD